MLSASINQQTLLSKVEYHEDAETRDRVKHVLVIENPTQQDLGSTFICAARNKVGQTRKLIRVASEYSVSTNLPPSALID